MFTTYAILKHSSIALWNMLHVSMYNCINLHTLAIRGWCRIACSHLNCLLIAKAWLNLYAIFLCFVLFFCFLFEHYMLDEEKGRYTQKYSFVCISNVIRYCTHSVVLFQFFLHIVLVQFFFSLQNTLHVSLNTIKICSFIHCKCEWKQKCHSFNFYVQYLTSCRYFIRLKWNVRAT